MYLKENNGETHLWYMKEDGTSFTRVTDDELGDHMDSPGWSADGRTIYFIKNTNQFDQNGIYSTKANGSDMKAVYKDNDTQSRKFYQVISAKNDEDIVFSYEIPRSGRKVIELYTMCPCGQRIIRLTNFETANAPALSNTESYAGSFSEGNEFLYFSQSNPAITGLKDINIWRINMDSKEMLLLRTVKASKALDAAPRVSPDGKHILISIDDLIYVMDSDGKNLAVLGTLKGHMPAWDSNSFDFYFSSAEIPGADPGIYRTDLVLSKMTMISGQPSAGIYAGFSVNK